jgi:outer membrane receptor for ferrienterochelin and colicins
VNLAESSQTVIGRQSNPLFTPGQFWRVFVVSELLLAFTSQSSSATIGGIVKDRSTVEPLVGANVSLAGTLLGTVSDSEGSFLLHGVPPGQYTLRVSYVGYHDHVSPIQLVEDDSLFVNVLLEHEEIKSEEVVVTATRTTRTIADIPVRVEAIPQEEIEEKLLMTPSNVAMLLNESTGMRVQTTSAASGTANLRIQGLSGRYAQILTDGIPNQGGMSAGFGLTQLIPLDLRQVEVIKGATSALYGSDAISGVVNFISKDPGPTPEASALINATTQGGFDIAAFYAQSFPNHGVTMLLSRNTQPRYDVDGDGFADVPEFTRTTLSPKVIVPLSEHLAIRTTVRILDEDRLGGAMNAAPSPAYTGAPYLEETQTRRIDGTMNLDFSPSKRESFSLNLATTNLRRNARCGLWPFNGTQNFLYADGHYGFTIDAHSILVGSAFNSERFTDRTGGGIDRGYRFSSPALFIQDEIKFFDRWTFLGGGRVDFHNVFGTFVTPRLSLMHRPTPALTFRVGMGTGFKAPTIFIEEAEEVGFRNVRPLANVRAERATSTSFDLNWRTFFDEMTATFNAAVYLSRLSNALVVDEDSLLAGVLHIRNATGTTSARGAEVSSKITYCDLTLSLGYTYIAASQRDKGITKELELNPQHSVGFVLVWEDEELSTKIGLENYWTGSQRLERNPYRDRSPVYSVTGFIAEKGLGHVRVFINFENIFDTRQTRFEPIFVGNLQGGSIRTLPIYAPLEGRVVNGGIRLVL